MWRRLEYQAGYGRRRWMPVDGSYTRHGSANVSLGYVNWADWQTSTRDGVDQFPPTRRVTYGDRTFGVIAARVWNSLPPDVTLHLQATTVKTFIDHPRSGVVYNFGRVCLSVWQTITFESLDVGSSFLYIRYISRGYGSSSYMKVIGSRSRSQEQKIQI